MAQFDLAPGLRFLSRKGWGADVSIPRLGNRVARERRTHVFVHHTVMVDDDSTPNMWDSEADIKTMMKRLQRVRPDLGLDVPYNFVAFLSSDNDGLTICEGRGEDRTGAHTKGHNTKAIAVSFAGDFQNRLIADDEIDKRMPLLSKFLGWLKFSASHPSIGDFEPMRNLGQLKPVGRNVFYHRDVSNTDCPGIKLERHLKTVTFERPA
jgi:N-acetylmuramoyl-L-alanine amidase